MQLTQIRDSHAVFPSSHLDGVIEFLRSVQVHTGLKNNKLTLKRALGCADWQLHPREEHPRTPASSLHIANSRPTCVVYKCEEWEDKSGF